MPSPKISVIVPCYNYGHFISETIDSVLAQTYSDYEIIIIDDGSNDGTTPQVIANEVKKNKRIKSITHMKNKGLSAARNSGIKNAKGIYILPLDSDDMIAPTYLEKTMALIIKENADLIYTHYKCFGQRNHTCYMSNDTKAIKAKLPFRDCLPVCSLYKKDDWKAFKGYDENMIAAEDWNFWLHFAKTDKKIMLLNEPLFHYRTHKNSLFNRTENLRSELIKKIKQNHPELYRLNNYYLTFNYLRYVVRRALLQIRLRKGRRVLRILGIYLIKPR